MTLGGMDFERSQVIGISIRVCFGLALLAAAGGAGYADDLSVEWAVQFVEAEATEEVAAGDVSDTSFAVDAEGNLLLLGTFTGMVDVDPGPEEHLLESSGGGDLFVVKLDPDGGFVWTIALPLSQGSGQIDGARMYVAADSSGSVYIAGSFKNTVDFDPGDDVQALTALSSFGEIFVLKLDADGAFLWANQIVATNASVVSIAADSSGSVALGGNFYGVADFDPGEEVVTLTSLLGTSHFICQWDADGALVWANQLRATTVRSSALGQDIAVDGAGNIYSTGTFNWSVEFGTKAVLASATSIFVAKLDSSGAVLWVRQLNQTDMSGGAYGLEVSVDGLGNVYTTGVFGGAIDCDPGPGTFILDVPEGERAVIAAKLNAAGNLIWANQIQATGPASGVLTSSAVDVAGNLYTVGQFHDTVDLDPGVELLEVTSAGDGDIYVRSLDANGAFVAGVALGGAGVDSATRAGVDALGNAYIIGEFTGTVDFDAGPGIRFLTAPADRQHTYIMKVSPVPCVAPPAPTGLMAGDGTGTDAVALTWHAVAGTGIEYQVLRSSVADVASATPISDWFADTTFLDMTADPPTRGPLNCNNQPIVMFNTHYYWIQARELGASCASEPSVSDPGYRGGDPVAVETAGGPDWGFAVLVFVLFVGLGAGQYRQRQPGT